MEIAGQMALKHKKTAYHDTSTLNILYFNVNPILGTQKPRKNGYRVLWKLHKQEMTCNLPASRAIYDRGIAHVWKIGGGLLQS